MNIQKTTHNSVHTPFFRRNKKLIFTVFFVVLWITALVLGLQMTRISRVECVMQDGGRCEEAVQAEFDGLRGSSLFSFHTQEIEKKVKNARPEIHLISYRKTLPNVLRVFLSPYPEALQFSPTGNPPYNIINEARIVISVEQDRRNSPLFVLDTNVRDTNLRFSATPSAYPNTNPSAYIYAPGEQLEPEMGKALVAIAKAMKKTSLSVQICRYTNPDIMTCTLENNRMFLIRAQDIDRELATLQRILNDATMNGYAGVIDVRFAQPVFRE